MRILHITPTLLSPDSGLAAVVAECATALHRSGVSITVAAPREPGDPVRPITFPCLLAERTVIPGLRTWHFTPHLERLIEAHYLSPPDLVHLHGLWLYPQSLGRRLAERWGCPLVISTHGMLEPWARRYHPWRKAAMWRLNDRRTVQSAQALVAASEQEAENLNASGIKTPIMIIPPGIEIPLPPDESAHRERNAQAMPGLPMVRLANSDGFHEPPPRTALFLSRLHPSKGLLLLVDAVSRLRPPGWRFVIAGPDEYNYAAEVNRAVQKAGVASWFAFHDAVHGDEKWRLYRSSDLFVLPSFNENFGLVVAEALGCGVPVVTTTVTPWRTLPTEGCGWQCEPTAAALTETLREALNTPPAKLRQMGARGATWIALAFTPAGNLLKLQSLYETLLH